MASPTDQPNPADHQRPFLRYLGGLGLGLVPVLVYWLSGVFTCPYGYYSGECPGPHDAQLANSFSGLGVVLYLVLVAAALALLLDRSLRAIGYGLLTMVFVDPIIGVVGCLTINGAVHRA